MAFLDDFLYFVEGFFKPSFPKFFAWAVLAIAGVWIFFLWFKFPSNRLKFLGRLRIYPKSVGGTSSLGAIYGAIIPILAGVGGFVFAVMSIIIPLSASNAEIHFVSVHFIGLMIFWLGTIVYLLTRLREVHSRSDNSLKRAETGLILTCTWFLLFLIPYLIITLRLLLQPSYFFNRITERVTREDFRVATQGNVNAAEEKLQPIVEKIRSSPDKQTVEKGFDALYSLVSKMEKNNHDRELSKGICITLNSLCLEIGRCSREEERSYRVSIEVLGLIRGIAHFYKNTETRSVILEFKDALLRLSTDWQINYPPDFYGDRYCDGLVEIGKSYSYLAEVTGGQKKYLYDKAKLCFEKSAVVYVERELSVDEALVKSELAELYRKLVIYCRPDSALIYLRMSVDTQVLAIEKINPKEQRIEHALANNYLGSAYCDFGKRSVGLTKKRYLDNAISAFSIALKELTPQDTVYVLVLNNLGNLYLTCAGASQGEDIMKYLNMAVDTFNVALLVCSELNLNARYASIQTNLGSTYLQLARGMTDKEKMFLLEKAHSLYDSALHVFKRAEYPEEYASVLCNKSVAFAEFAQTEFEKDTLNKEEYLNNLKEAEVNCLLALEVFSKEEFPINYTITKAALGRIYRQFAECKDKRNYLEKALGTYEDALQISTFTESPEYYAKIQHSRAIVSWDLMSICSSEERMFYYKKARESFLEAAKIWFEEPTFSILEGYVEELDYDFELLQNLK